MTPTGADCDVCGGASEAATELTIAGEADEFTIAACEACAECLDVPHCVSCLEFISGEVYEVYSGDNQQPAAHLCELCRDKLAIKADGGDWAAPRGVATDGGGPL